MQLFILMCCTSSATARLRGRDICNGGVIRPIIVLILSYCIKLSIGLVRPKKRRLIDSCDESRDSTTESAFQAVWLHVATKVSNTTLFSSPELGFGPTERVRSL